MKKTIIKVLSLALTLLVVISVFGCSEKNNDQNNENNNDQNIKGQKTYIEYFSALVEVQSINPDISPNASGALPKTYEEYLNYVQEKNRYVVVRAELTGNWVQKNFDEEEYSTYLKRDYENSGNKMKEWLIPYVEMPFQIKEVLDGDGSLVSENESLNIVVPALAVKWVSGITSKFKYTEYPLTLEAYNTIAPYVRPRIGYEYIIILRYGEKTGGLFTNPSDIICELSTPEEYFAWDHPEAEWDPTKPSPVPKYYYEVLERYNITIE